MAQLENRIINEDDVLAEIDDLSPYDMLSLIEDHNPDLVAFSLIGVGALRRWLEEVEEELVLKANVEGDSWGHIAKCLGRSKQGVWAKHRDPQEITPEKWGSVSNGS